MRKNFLQNLLFAATVLLLAGALAFWGARTGISGAGAPDTGSTSGAGTAGMAARVTIDGCDGVLLSLTEDGCHSIEGGRLPVTLEIADGRIRFVESRCPDHICEHYGWLSQEYDQAVCIPAGVVVTVERQ